MNKQEAKEGRCLNWTIPRCSDIVLKRECDGRADASTVLVCFWPFNNRGAVPHGAGPYFEDGPLQPEDFQELRGCETVAQSLCWLRGAC